MTDYTKKSLVYSCAVILISSCVLLFREERVREKIDWESAVSRGTAASYREFFSKWRTGRMAGMALSAWERSLTNEFTRLDWKDPAKVNDFIASHPEYQITDLRKIHYDAVIKDGSYYALKRYVDYSADGDPWRNDIMERMDTLALSEVTPAVKNNDYQALQRLSKKYSDWRGRGKYIDNKIATALNNSAKSEWTEKMSVSRSEQELRRFITKYKNTSYAKLAEQRIDSLYDDFEFVKAKGTLKAYVTFADGHPNSPHVDEAWQCVARELEGYVFKRKTLNKADESEVRTLLERYKQSRPASGALYGAGGRYTSPLQIITPSYGSTDYFVKLVNKSNGRSVGIYVRAGATIEVEIPDGTYSVRYSTGSQWYGSRFLFGLNASYNRANRDFTFSNGSGYSLTLQKVANGNLQTSSMSASDF